MNKNPTIVLTGAAGFVASVMLERLNNDSITNIIVVDDFSISVKHKNWSDKRFIYQVDRARFIDLLPSLEYKFGGIDAIIHLGARTDTTEFNYSIHEELNVKYSQAICRYAKKNKIPFIYASSAATYGNGENGYEDSHHIIDILNPLNPYGVSKNEFDKWILSESNSPYMWAGLKFFNVYGHNEYHKGRMASVIFHSYNQINDNGSVKLFKSHKEGYENGQQLRDFVYVKDVVNVISWMLNKMLKGDWEPKISGLYNVGTGTARSFYDLAKNTFIAQGLEPNITFIDMPIDIRDKYQYFTEAKMDKLKNIGYDTPFTTLEDGINDYVKNYLSK